MLRPIWRIVAVALAAPTLLVGTAMAAAASEHQAADTYYNSTGAAANSQGAWTLHLSAGSGWRGHNLFTWYRARTADADALGARSSTVDTVAYEPDGQSWHAGRESRDYRRQSVGWSERESSRVRGAAELAEHRSRTHTTEAAYHQSGARAGAAGASTSTTTAAASDYGEHGYVWGDQSTANANALGADADHTTSYATHDNWSYDNWSHSGYRHDDCDHGQNGHNNQDDSGTVGYSSSSAHAGYDGAWAGDTDSAAAYGD